MRILLKNLILCFLFLGTSAFFGGGSAIAQTVIPQSGWTLHYVDSEELVGEDGAATNAFDGQPLTLWHTQWSGNPDPPHPHDLQMNLGAVYQVDGIRYLPRQDNGRNGRIGQYEVYVAMDSGTPPTTPPILSQWTLVASGAFPNSSAEQEVLFNGVTSQYVWLRALSEAQGTGNPWTTVGELNVLGTLISGGLGITPPTATVTVGGQQDFDGINGVPPYTFSLVADTSGGASVNATTGLYTAGPNAGTSTVRVTDSNLETADATVTVTGDSPPALTDDFADGNFTGWQVIDEGTLTAPSAWAVVSGRLQQTSNIYGGSLEPTPLPKPGTFVWYTNGLSWSNYHLAVQVESTDNDALGVMVRYQDPNNYYRFSWDAQRSYRRLVKVVNGTFTLLAEEAVPYVTGQSYQLEVMVEGNTLEVRVDGAPLFGGLITDSALATGSVALYSWGNQNSIFDNVIVTTNGGGGGTPLTITPPTATVPTGGQQTFTGAGGTPPYVFIVQGDMTGGASVDFLTGLYTAGPNPGTTTVHMADSSVPELTADAFVTVQGGGGSPVSITPPTAMVPTGGQQTFTGAGGTPSYTFNVVADTSGGATVNATTGLYTAGPNAGTSTVRVTDSNLETADATVTVTGDSPPALTDDFADGNFTGWQVIDEGTLTAPSAWAVVSGRLQQTSNIYGGSLEPTPLPKPGTFVWYTNGLSWSNYHLAVQVESTDNDALGVMVRYQDPNNYYRFSWDAQRSYRRLVKVVNGTFTLLAEEAVPYVTGQSYQLEVMVEGNTLEVRVDGAPLFGGLITDSALATGSVALYSWGNQNSIFDNVIVTTNGGGGGTPLTITPPTATVPTGGQQTFTGAGGTPPYTFNVVADTSGGASVNATTGLYTAGPNAGTSTVRVTDSNLETADATVTVTGDSPPALTDDFADGNFTGWQVIDEGTLTAPSAWAVVSGRLQQTSNIYGGSLEPTPLPKPGTFVWYTNGLSWSNYHLAVQVESTDNDALGVMVRYQDPNNYYRFSWDAQRSYRRLVKVVNGTFTLLAEEAVPYVTGQSYQLEVMVEGNTLEVRVDGAPLFGGLITDSALATGSVALYSWGNQNSIFDNVIVTTNGGGGGTPLTITPPTATVPTGGQQTFTGAGGTPPYVFIVQGDMTGGASVDFLTGLYTAGPNPGTTTVHMADSSVPELTADAFVTVQGGGGSPVSITPPTAMVPTGGQQTFTGAGGTPPYTFNVVADTSGGATVNATTGLYTAGPNAGTSTVRVTDSNLETVDAGITVVTNAGLVPQAGWTVHFVNSQEAGSPAANAFDGTSSTKWRTQNGVSFPHDLQVNLGNVYELEGFRITAQTPIEKHAISFFEFYVSEDGVSWGLPVASGELSKDFSEMEVNFPRIAGQFVRIRPLGWHDGGTRVEIGELNVLGASFSGNYAPNGTIDSPIDNVTINVGGSVSFTGTSTDSNGDSSLSFLWDFGDSAIPDSTIEDPGLITFSNPGTYTVTFTVTDPFGLSDPIPGTVVVKVLAGANSVLSRNDWAIEFVNSEEVILDSNAAANVFDGDTNTIWHSQWQDVEGPHEIQIDLGAVFAIDAFRYLPRSSGTNGRIDYYHIYVSPDRRDWGTPVAIGQFANNAVEQRVQFSPKIGQFIRLVAITEVNGNRWASMAEANVEGVCQDPFVRIINPLTNEVQGRPDLTVTASVCLTQAAHAGWGVKFSVDSGAQEQTITLPVDGVIHPDTFQWTVAGLVGDGHQIEVFIVDTLGMPVVGNNTSDMVTNIGIGDVFAAIGDSITVGVGDDDNTDGTSQDGRNTNTGLGFIPILNDMLTNERGYPHNIHNDGISGDSSAGLLVRAPKILKSRKKTSAFLIMIGSNDANSGLVPSGKGLNPPGPGTFKDNLQKIIDLLHNSAQGREVYLAKVPYTTNVVSDQFILDYNIAIQELVMENSLPDIVPDFYSHFLANQLELQSDGLHPSGNGYKSMASIWCIEVSGGACPIP